MKSQSTTTTAAPIGTPAKGVSEFPSQTQSSSVFFGGVVVPVTPVRTNVE
jgi:hypothetical protein